MGKKSNAGDHQRPHTTDRRELRWPSSPTQSYRCTTGPRGAPNALLHRKPICPSPPPYLPGVPSDVGNAVRRGVDNLQGTLSPAAVSWRYASRLVFHVDGGAGPQRPCWLRHGRRGIASSTAHRGAAVARTQPPPSPWRGARHPTHAGNSPVHTGHGCGNTGQWTYTRFGP